MIVYNGSDAHDLLLAQWWGIMRQRGELATTLDPDLEPLGAFMAWFRAPRAVILGTDPDGVACAAWFDPALRGAWFGYWQAPRVRHRRAGLRRLVAATEAGLANWPILLTATRSESVSRMLGRLGYTMTGPVPGLLDPGAGAWVGWLTKETFNGRWRRESLDQTDQRNTRSGAVSVHAGVRGRVEAGS